MGLFSKIFGRGKVVERKKEPELVYIPDQDEKMTWAIEKARLTLWHFEESLKTPQYGQQHVSIKVKIEDGDQVEHIWLDDPDFDNDGNLFGIVGNTPVNVNNVKLGQHIGIEKSLVSDWMIVEQGRLIGGYTIRAIRDRIPEAEKKAFDDSIGMFIDEGVDYFKADFNTPEGAILSLESAFKENNLEKAISCKDFYQEARLMLAKMDFELDEEMIQNMSEVLEASFIKYIEEQGMPDFSMITNAFPKREKIDDRHWIITEICVYPDGGISEQKLSTYKTDRGWRVIGVSE